MLPGAILHFVSFFLSMSVPCTEEEKKLLRRKTAYLSIQISRALVNWKVRSDLLNVMKER